ncbi:MAG: hemolysin family protein [Thermodesulfobacteriota bacterium]
MLQLVLAVGLAIGISFLCSVAEAVLYSVPWSHIEKLRKSGQRRGELLYRLRVNVDEPITAILTLNTVAHTAGASVAGAAAAQVFGQDSLFAFSIFFTAAILLLSEIIPKTLGVVYTRPLSTWVAGPLQVLVILLRPVVDVSSYLVRFMGKRKLGPEASEEDVRAMVSLSRKAGILKPYEEMSIQNILTLDSKRVKDIMTPRMVIFSLPAHLTVEQAREAKLVWPHSRIPVYEGEDPEEVIGIVYRRELLEALANDQDAYRISDLMRSAHFVLESLTLDRLLVQFLESRMHLAVVLDEYGGLAGVVTLEDVLEEILGNEIVDETDQVVDMRELARQRRERLLQERRNP